jgi:hypothetical protein
MTTVKYLRRSNLGNYEHEEFEVAIPLETEDTEIIYSEALEVKQLVLSLLGIKKADKVEKVFKKKDEEVVVVEAPVTVEQVQVQLDLPIKEEEVVVPVKEEEVVAPVVKEKKEKKETKAKAPKASKATLYDRELDTHKSLIGRWLDAEFKSWNDSSNIQKFGKASRSLSGKAEFLDESGEILESFKQQFKEIVSA